MLLPCTCLRVPEACLFGLFPHLLSIHSSFFSVRTFSVKFLFPYCPFCKWAWLLSPVSAQSWWSSGLWLHSGLVLMDVGLFLLFPYPVSWNLPHSWHPSDKAPFHTWTSTRQRRQTATKGLPTVGAMMKEYYPVSFQVGWNGAWVWESIKHFKRRAAPCREFLMGEAREEGAPCTWIAIFSSIGNMNV